MTHRTTSISSSKTGGASSYRQAAPGRSSASAPRLRTRQLVADLAQELDRIKGEADRLLFERDEEVSCLILAD